MCAELLPACKTIIRAKNSNISRLWLVEIGDRVGRVDGPLATVA